jgi:ribosomal protein S18 acetylase RimI-like enzyme
VGTIRLVPETAAKETHKGAVRSFFVRPEQRGQGIGAALMSALIEAARGEVEQLTLSVMAENTTAIALYERFGFTIYGVEPRARKSEAGYADKALMALLLR